MDDLPETIRGNLRSFCKRLQLVPGDFTIDGAVTRERGKSAVGAGDNPLLSNQLGILLDALCNQLGMLDKVGRQIDDPGNENVVIRQLDLLPDRPFVGMSCVGAFEQ